MYTYHLEVIARNHPTILRPDWSKTHIFDMIPCKHSQCNNSKFNFLAEFKKVSGKLLHIKILHCYAFIDCPSFWHVFFFVTTKLFSCRISRKIWASYSLLKTCIICFYRLPEFFVIFFVTININLRAEIQESFGQDSVYQKPALLCFYRLPEFFVMFS